MALFRKVVRHTCSLGTRALRPGPDVASRLGVCRLYHESQVSQQTPRVSPIFVPTEEFVLAAEDTDGHHNLSGSLVEGDLEDVVFEMFKTEEHGVPMGKFLSALCRTGLRKTDPRLKEMMTKLDGIFKMHTDAGSPESLLLDRETFKSVIAENIVLISRAFRQRFVVPEFQDFLQYIDDFYWKCKANTGGQVASYIPQLAKYDPDLWGVSLCTVDGQRHSIGDVGIPFTIQSAGKPLNYAIALSELGLQLVHQYIGQEPSGRMFNELVLDYNNKPHNPMVNAGAIVVCSLLLYLAEGEMKASEKFDWMCQHYRTMAGGEYLGFNNAIFLSEREAADRNYAIGFYMKENKCYPEGSVLRDAMNFYFQMCSLEVNCETLSVLAATLANGGICPITGQQALDVAAVRNVLSLMHSCGMYDYSGQFAFKVGLPAKSGVSGCTMVVVPNVMGLALWSPPLDSYGNSVRGVQFCEELIRVFNFHHFDNLRHCTQKKDPRRQKYETKASNVVSLIFSAANGDVTALRRYYLSGADMSQCDYDGRTALHLAAAQGHLSCVKFLLKVCRVHHLPKDRWGHTPLDEAVTFGHRLVADLLENWEIMSEAGLRTDFTPS